MARIGLGEMAMIDKWYLLSVIDSLGDLAMKGLVSGGPKMPGGVADCLWDIVHEADRVKCLMNSEAEEEYHDWLEKERDKKQARTAYLLGP